MSELSKVYFHIECVENDSGGFDTYHFLGRYNLALWHDEKCKCGQPLNRAYSYTISMLKKQGLLRKRYKPMCRRCYNARNK